MRITGLRERWEKSSDYALPNILKLHLVFGFWLALCICPFSLAQERRDHNFLPKSNIVKVAKCQDENLETLTTQLIADLPSYANRISQRARRRDGREAFAEHGRRAYRQGHRTVDLYSYVIIAGRPEFAPLTLGPGEYKSIDNLTTNAAQPQQVFITTLERQYTSGKPVELQQYHWLFLTRTRGGWRLAMMFSRTGTYPAKFPPTRPRDSSYGVIAQAIRAWLSDCTRRSS